MAGYGLNEFCNEVREVLGAEDCSASREVVRQKLEQLLTDEDFLAQYTSADHEVGVTQIYEDPELKFCVLAYNMAAPRVSPPHDHGSSWAVYGQAAGHTDMTVWTMSADNELAPTQSFRLNPGQAGLFDVGDIHSIDYDQGAKFVRVTGVDLSQEKRRVYDPETGKAKEIEQVGTGSR